MAPLWENNFAQSLFLAMSLIFAIACAWFAAGTAVKAAVPARQKIRPEKPRRPKKF
jgi:hypothetical protein